ncbi:MAG: type II toxin-antitoxin system ParD family antitoxin [Bacteroidetes bacterium]|nr:type II toxin-antitoxin system ParD family antitoxin [Bacteroidota bacterium]
MNVSLPRAQEKYVKGLVKKGRYNSASEVVRTGLRLLEEQERINELKLKDLRAAIQKGLDSGPPVFMTRDELQEMIHDHAEALRKEAKKEKRPAAR